MPPEVGGIHNDQVFVMIHQYGYGGLAVFLAFGIVGLPLPDETLLTAVGYLVYQGSLDYFPALLSGVIGASIGISLSYAVGIFLGRPFIVRFGRYIHVTPVRLDKIESYFLRYGDITLVLGLFVPGVRHVMAIVAGMGSMKVSRFMFSAYLGVCLWVTTFITLGRFVGPHIQFLHAHIPLPLLFLLVVSACGAIFTWVFGRWWRRGRRRD